MRRKPRGLYKLSGEVRQPAFCPNDRIWSPGSGRATAQDRKRAGGKEAGMVDAGKG